LLALLALPAVAATMRGRLARPVATPVAPPATPVAIAATTDRVLPVEQIAQLTGPSTESLNPTAEAYGVHGTDLGHTFLAGDDLYMIFGDSFGPNKSDWRSNVAAVIATDQDPSDGLTFDRMITDRPGHAKELLAAKKVDGDEITVIPTSGVAVGDRLLRHSMSVTCRSRTGARPAAGP
jgi:hypothetical protein